MNTGVNVPAAGATAAEAANSRAIACLRIGIGVFFLVFGEY